MSHDSDAESGIATALGDGTLIVVSNRQPYSHEYDDAGEVRVNRPAGGLTAGLDPVMQQTDGTWVAWGDGEADAEVADEDDRVRVPPEDPGYALRRVWLADEQVDRYYYGYSNRVLWPLCHGGLWKTDFAEDHWKTYEEVNGIFADAVAEEAGDDGFVWFQDYHFTLAPQLVREQLPDTFVMHFWHIPWPGWDTFRSLPNGERVLAGLLGNDLLGFHLDAYAEHFLDCVERTLEEATVDRDGGRVEYRGATTTVEAFPLSVDYEAIADSAGGFGDDDWATFREEYGVTGNRVALGVDRLDYTKGIPERLDALERLFEDHPEWRGELTYIQKASESRSVIPDYRDLQDRVKEGIDRINDRFGTDDWQPVVYVDEHLPERTLNGVFRHSDVMLVSAVRDGMNLVAKEYVAANVDGDGVLVLSDQAGVHEELGQHALTINPHDTGAFAETIQEALTLPDEERGDRMRQMREWVSISDLDQWMADIFETADEVRTKRKLGIE